MFAGTQEMLQWGPAITVRQLSLWRSPGWAIDRLKLLDVKRNLVQSLFIHMLEAQKGMGDLPKVT
jgi:hypothetical protein